MQLERQHERPAVSFDIPDVNEHPEVFIERDFSPIEEIDQIPDNNIDEGAGVSFCRDFKSVCYKFWISIFPRNDEAGTNYLRNWDLWGLFLLGIIFILTVKSTFNFIKTRNNSLCLCSCC